MPLTINKRGRPAKPAADRKRNNVTIRMTDALRSEIEAAAKMNGRSVSEEIERRLIRWSDEQKTVVGGARQMRLVKALAAAAQMIGGEHWDVKPRKIKPIFEAWEGLFRSHRKELLTGDTDYEGEDVDAD